MEGVGLGRDDDDVVLALGPVEQHRDLEVLLLSWRDNRMKEVKWLMLDIEVEIAVRLECSFPVCLVLNWVFLY